jgi:hypothetical protein
MIRIDVRVWLGWRKFPQNGDFGNYIGNSNASTPNKHTKRPDPGVQLEATPDLNPLLDLLAGASLK